MNNYLTLMRKIMIAGVDRDSRSGMTRALFCEQLRFDLRDGFPAVTTKRLAFKQVVAELLWFLSGSTSVEELQAMGCHIWDADAERWGKSLGTEPKLGRVYGAQWRNYAGCVDQIALLAERLKKDPYSRYHIVTAWNPAELSQMALPACHMLFQVFCYPNGNISLAMTQRSCDMFLGVPFNIASYAILLHMLAEITGRTAFELIVTLNDVHVYHNHFEAAREQMARETKRLPYLDMHHGQVNKAPNSELDEFCPIDFALVGYEHHPAIKAPLSVG